MTNEAAERLHGWADALSANSPAFHRDVDQALADERRAGYDEGLAAASHDHDAIIKSARRATVERMRPFFEEVADDFDQQGFLLQSELLRSAWRLAHNAILDAETGPPKHRDTCSIHGGWECDCGLDAEAER